MSQDLLTPAPTNADVTQRGGESPTAYEISTKGPVRNLSVRSGAGRLFRDPLGVLSFAVLFIGTLIVFWKMHGMKLPSEISREKAQALGKTVKGPDLAASILDWIRPWLWGRGDMLKPSTATGGDMGAHVWSADFVARGLFPKGRLTGWSDDWMFGIPVLNFYFPLPTLVIAALGKVIGAGVAFKFITALGILTLPTAAWASGRFAKLPRPIPTLMGVAAFIFLFGRNYDLFIYGGNILSTMAGEFSFSISLSLAVLFLGMYVHVLRTGEHRGRTAVVLACTGLCHLLPTMWAGATALLLTLAFLDGTKLKLRNASKFLAILGGAVGVAVLVVLVSDLQHAIVVVGAAMFALAVIDQIASQRGVGAWTFNLPQLRDALLTLGCGGALAGFWIVPFYKNIPYTNDMGWEKSTRYVKFLFPFWQGKGNKPPADSQIIAVVMIFAAIAAIAAFGSLARAMINRAKSHGGWTPFAGPLSVIVSTLFGLALGLNKGTWQAGALGLAAGLILSFVVMIILAEPTWWQKVFLTVPVATLGVCTAVFWGDSSKIKALAEKMKALTPEQVKALGCNVSERLDRTTWIVAAGGLLILSLIVLAAINNLQYDRWAVAWSSMLGTCAALFVLAPQFRLWNARVLPFWFVSICLLGAYGAVKAANGVSQAAHWYGEPRRTFPHASKWGIAAAAAFVFVAVGLPLNLVPNGLPITKVNKGAIGLQLAGKTTDSSQTTGWSGYNYKGYEGQGPWTEYKALMDEAKRVGKENGCGRAIYEYEDTKLGSFGTTLSPMLLPFWTKGCIGSVEGVYFESSASMPYHWLNAALITAPTTNDDKGVKKYSGPSNPQRDLPYASFDLARGIKKLQAGGVRYYLALTDIAKTAAASIPELKKVGESGVFVFYEIANSELVSPLSEEPMKIKGIDEDQYGGWLDVEVDQYNSPDQYPQTLVWSGPKAWSTMQAKVCKPMGVRAFGANVTKDTVTARKPLQLVVVSNIKKNNVDISFTVDRIGVPVVVKTSFFPNWTAQGAKGPYRSMPNFMVVIPTSKNVKLHYGYSGADKVGYLATFTAIAGVVLLHRTRRRRTFGVLDELDHIPTNEHGLQEVITGETSTQGTGTTQSTTQNTRQGKTTTAQTATATSSLPGQTADSAAESAVGSVGSVGSAIGTETLNAGPAIPKSPSWPLEPADPAAIETIVVENSALATASSSSVSQVVNGEVTTAQTSKDAASIKQISDEVTPALRTATEADDTGSVAGHEPKKA
jgi:6-pyruvoyl-tetrahydropterin synthase related domain